MGYAIALRCPVDEVPKPVLERLASTLKELAHSLEGVPVFSDFWSSLHESPLVVDLGQWRFVIDVDRDHGIVSVVRAVPPPRAASGRS